MLIYNNVKNFKKRIFNTNLIKKTINKPKKLTPANIAFLKSINIKVKNE